MIKLHERLSEFSYGYGITRETLDLLASVGRHAVPFLPSLIHENELGFDVAFSAPGAVLMLQFKLGEQLSRFRKTSSTQTVPDLARPFWRFGVHTGEEQFKRLRAFEQEGAEVYYVAPRFSDWRRYEALFRDRQVLDQSLLITPLQIDAATPGPGAAHRVVYDRSRRHVCSEPVEMPEVSVGQYLERLLARAAQTADPLALTIKRLSEPVQPAGVAVRRLLPRQRDLIYARARTPVEGDAAIVALEAWLQGAQTIFIGVRADSSAPSPAGH